MKAGPDWGGGIQDLMSQFMMFQMLSKMYPGDEKGEKVGGKETYAPYLNALLQGTGKIGGESIPETPLPPAREMPPELSIMQPPMGGQPPMGQAQQQPGIDMQQILQMLQMLGGIPGLTK